MAISCGVTKPEIVATTVWEVVSIILIVLESPFDTYARDPFGANAIAYGSDPTRTVARLVFATVSITETLPDHTFTVYKNDPLGVKRASCGYVPMGSIETNPNVEVSNTVMDE